MIAAKHAPMRPPTLAMITTAMTATNDGMSVSTSCLEAVLPAPEVTDRESIGAEHYHHEHSERVKGHQTTHQAPNQAAASIGRP